MSVNITGQNGQVDKLQFDVSGNLKVVSTSAGGGMAQLQIRDSLNNWTDVGYSAGDLNVPVSVQNSTIAVTQSGAWSTGRTWALSNGTDSVSVSGTVTSNQGAPNTLANAWPVKVTDGANVLGTTANPISAGSNATISAGNSTTTPLGAGGIFTGTAIDLLNFSTFRISGISDVASATNGLQIQFSNDGTNWDFIRQTTFNPAIEGFYAVYNRVARYARVNYINGASPQTYFRMQTVVVPDSAEFQRRFISEVPADQNTSILTQSVIIGKTTGGGGGYVAVKVNPSGTLTVDASNSTNVSVIGTVTANQGGAPWSQNVTQFGGNAVVTGIGASGVGVPRVTVANDSNILVTQSGAWNINALTSITNAVITNADTTIGGIVAPSKLFLIGGKTTDATPQYQPIPLTNGGAAVKVDGSAITQPVSWSGQTVTVTQGTGANLHVVLDSGTITTITNPVTVSQGVAANLNATVTGTITANQGGTWNINTLTGITNNVNMVGTQADNSANSSAKLPVIPARANAASPAWMEGNEVPLSTDLVGNLRTVGSGNYTVVQGTGANLHAVVDSGTITADTQVRNSSNVWTDVGYASGNLNMPVNPAVANANNPSITEGAFTPLSVDDAGNLRTTIGDSGFIESGPRYAKTFYAQNDISTPNEKWVKTKDQDTHELLFMVLIELKKLNKRFLAANI